MDRSFLSHKSVVAASRKFVCIRIATYEDAAENAVLKRIFAPRGTLQNTVFGILTPDGKTSIVRAGRSPAWAFGGVAGPGIHQQAESVLIKMGDTMEAIALAYPGKGKAATGSLRLPYLADLRVALNVTACDRQPLVAVYGNAAQRKTMEAELTKLAWSDQFMGQVQYVAASKAEEFKAVKGLKAKAGFIVIQPEPFGLSGEVISEIAPNAKAGELKNQMAKALGKHQPSKLTYDQHRRAGAQAGKRWESKTPNTDALGRRPR